MSVQRLPPNDPREWLNRARSNLARARANIPDAYLEDQCFDAQQCAEKAIKAVFIHRGTTFPRTHDLKNLLMLLRTAGLKIPKYVEAAAKLTPFAVLTRYPDLIRPVSPRQCQRAIHIAEAVLFWAERQVDPSLKKRKTK